MRILLLISFLLILVGCTDSDLQRLEAFSGIELPDGVEVVSKEDKWISPIGDGDSIRVCKVNENTLLVDEKECSKNGFSKALVVDMKVRLPILERYIDTDFPVCFKYEITLQEAEAIFIQKGIIIYYWGVS